MPNTFTQRVGDHPGTRGLWTHRRVRRTRPALETCEPRALMSAAGVPIVPGAQPGTIDELMVAAERVGYPVMLKAASGGGGKGMRFVDRPEDLAGAYERAQSEALKSFGDATPLGVITGASNAKREVFQVLQDFEINIVV